MFHTLAPRVLSFTRWDPEGPPTPPTVLGYLSPVGARIDLQWIEPADVTKMHHFWRPPPAEMGDRLINIRLILRCINCLSFVVLFLDPRLISQASAFSRYLSLYQLIWTP